MSAQLWTDEVGYECPPLDRCRWGMSAHLWTDAGGVRVPTSGQMQVGHIRQQTEREKIPAIRSDT
jgi:hypothetical protein